MKLLLAALLSTLLFAKGIDVESLIKGLYPHAKSVEKKSAILTPSQSRAIEKRAGAKLPSHLVRYYRIDKGKKEVFAIVIVQKVRTKKAAVMYFIADGAIEHIEILAFGEPPEFKPKKNWLEQFSGKTDKAGLKVGEDIAASSGATLSAKNVTKGARLALAIYEIVRRKQ